MYLILSKTKTTHLVLLLQMLFFASCGMQNQKEASEEKQQSNIIDYKTATAELTPAEKVGQLFMPAAYINDTEEGIQSIEKLIREENVGALCFFHSRISTAANFGSTKKAVVNTNSLERLKELIARYQKAAKYPLLIAVDAEWGLAMRVENTPQYPYAITLGAMQNQTDLVYEVAKNMAVDLKDAGIHWNLAPVVDVNNNPKNPVIGFRSFGENKQSVTDKAIAFNKGLQSQGILSCLKHFPGHGDTETDSHLGLPVIDKSKENLFNVELYPFGKLIQSDVDAVMIGHLSVPALADGNRAPATISKEIIQGTLRKDLGFQNVVISDALNMKSVSKMFPTKGELEWTAFDAGNDVLCFAENTKEGVETILANASESQIEASFKRLWKLKEKAYAVNNTSDEVAFSKEELNAKIATKSITLYQGDVSKLTAFRDKDFSTIAINKTVEDKFSKPIALSKQGEYYTTSESSISTIKKQVADKENLLIALYPPKVRTKNKFEISDEELEFINDMSASKNVVLYIFGNPFALNHLNTDKTQNIVLAYQNFSSFQEIAKQHFLGKVEAKGKLPVTL